MIQTKRIARRPRASSRTSRRFKSTTRRCRQTGNTSRSIIRVVSVQYRSPYRAGVGRPPPRHPPGRRTQGRHAAPRTDFRRGRPRRKEKGGTRDQIRAAAHEGLPIRTGQTAHRPCHRHRAKKAVAILGNGGVSFHSAALEKWAEVLFGIVNVKPAPTTAPARRTRARTSTNSRLRLGVRTRACTDARRSRRYAFCVAFTRNA